MKPLDMADKYEPLSYQDEYADPDSEPTVKINMEAVLPKVIVEDDEPTLPSLRYPFTGERNEKQYPGIGLIIVLTTGIAFWFLPVYYLVLWLIAR